LIKAYLLLDFGDQSKHRFLEKNYILLIILEWANPKEMDKNKV
jgi:hypothetical protein